MYIQVRLLNGLLQPLWYTVPADWSTEQLKGSLVTVPVRTRTEIALVTQVYHALPEQVTFTVKAALAQEAFPADGHYHDFITKLAHYYCIDPIYFIKRLRHCIQSKPASVQSPPATVDANSCSVTLTREQQTIVDRLDFSIKSGSCTPTLLHGVTGSGKTEVYKKLIGSAIKQNKSVILLLPEVTLALQFEQLLKKSLADILICGFHSATAAVQKRIAWKLLLQQQALLLIGVHLPVLLPVANLGLIIVDEEHESGYQEKKYPRVNSKEAALLRAHQYNIPVLLGSATPSISSLYNVKARGWQFFQLKKRFAGSFPIIKVVDLKQNRERKQFWISGELQHAIQDRLDKKEQTIIFLNRRGYSFFVQCKQCSFIFECASCSVSLTLHHDNRLCCHYCGAHRLLPNACPDCQDTKGLLKKGIGTQQVVTILKKMFPPAVIARADLDTTKKKKEWCQTVEQFNQGAIDIMVGTQTITKGFHFPRVTLVGILWADLNLHFPFYNATESCLQQLVQVAGRAGRQSKESLVVVQTMSNHTVFNYLDETKYLSFYQQEMKSRKEVKYPPYVRFAEIELKHHDETVVEQDALDIACHLNQEAQDDTVILGPAKPPVHKLKNYHVRVIYIKSDTMDKIINLFKSVDPLHKSQVCFVPNPL